MSLDSFFQDRHTPAKPVRPTIRRRLLGRGNRLRTLGMAAGLLSLGLTYGPPAHAASGPPPPSAQWDGTVADWYATTGSTPISHWIINGNRGNIFPGPSDDAANTFLNAAMTLGADATVHSFFSNSAFTLLGGTFSGSQANAASTLTVNNVFTLNGGTINNFTVQAGVQQTGTPTPPAPTVVATSANNIFTNTVINANLDLATNTNAFADFQNTNTVNGRISLGTTTGRLDIFNGNANLILGTPAGTGVTGSAGSLVGFGLVNQDGGQATLTNNGTVNANTSGQTLTLSQDNFNNAGTTRVTSGATLTVNSASDTQTAGLTQVDGVLNLVNAPLALNGGTLDGTGTINGSVNNTGGTVSPGDSPGTLTIAGNYTQGSGGTLNIEFTNGAHDLLNVTGLTTTGGLLDVNFLGSAPFTGGTGAGSQFAFLDYNTLAVPGMVGGLTQYFTNEMPTSNTMGTIMGHNGFTYELINDTTNKMLDLQVLTVGTPAVPEASTTVSFGLLLALGLGGVVIAARRKKRA